MTTQDWMPDLRDDEELSASRSSRRRWLIAAVLVVVLALAAVVVAVVGSSTVRPVPAGGTSRNAKSSPTAVQPAPAPLVIEAELTDPRIAGGRDIGPLAVAAEPIQGGVSPERVPHFDSCQADRTTLQYLPVQVTVPTWEPVAARLTVETTSTTPAGVGRIGFFFQAGRESTPCVGGVWPMSDSFLANMQQSHITGYIVLDQAFTASTPRGRPDVLRSLRLRVSDVRLSGRPATVGAPSIGSLCPGTENELCAPLG